MRNDYIWKNVIEQMFEDFCFFFIPDVAEVIDFSKKYDFLDKELEQISLDSVENPRYLDKLIKVYLKNGNEQWILIHTEVQGYQDKDFAERMFIYFYRIYDKFKKKVLSFAILTDKNKSYKPDTFKYEFYGVKQEYRFRLYKVVEQEDSQLMNNKNPFSMVVLAAKYSLKAGNTDNIKIGFKLKLMKLMIQRNYAREQIRYLFKFINGIIKLSDEMKQEIFYKKFKKIAGGTIMEILTDFEEVAMRKGMEKGMEKEKIMIAKNLISFDDDIEKIAKVTGLPIQKIKKLKKEMV